MNSDKVIKETSMLLELSGLLQNGWRKAADGD
jgi:hypothetical protein